MESTDTTHIVEIAKSWISTQTRLTNTVLHIFQLERRGSDYEVGVEGTFGGTTKKYVVTVNTAGSVIGHREMSDYSNRPGSNSLLFTVAFAFSIVAVVGFGVYFVILLFVAIAFFAIIAIIPAVFFVIGLYCLMRINRIRELYNAGKYQEALQENTIGLGILALIFNGVITGVLLLVARSSMQ